MLSELTGSARQESSEDARFTVVVPAAGSGTRMAADRPKQYLSLGNSTVLEITLCRLLAHPKIKSVIVALSASDEYWAGTRYASDDRVTTVVGGSERAESVFACLEELLQSTESQADPWILVHDAARPCISHEELDFIFDSLKVTDHGLVLGVRIGDTVKSTGTGATIAETVDRSSLWLAHTPQVFKLRELHLALTACIKENRLVTDEASAMEVMGKAPKMILGSPFNIKITTAVDLQLAELFLENNPWPGGGSK